MQAVQMIATGGPEVLRLVELPEPQIQHPTQLRVRLAAAGVNPIDTKVRSRGLFYPDALPAILGCDGAGEVVAVGAGVTRFAVGDRVWFCNGGLGADPGNYAEFTLVDEAVAQPLRDGVDLVTAAAGPLVLLTAWEALFDRAGLQPGQQVLIHAGAGGVGHVAIQLAVLAGARVCATVGDAAKAAWVRSLGAELAINYREQDFAAAVLDWTEGSGVEVALESQGPAVFQATLPAVAHYGKLITLLDPGPGIDWKEARIRNLSIGFELMLTPQLRALPQALAHQGEILRRCATWMAEGKLRVHVSQTFPLAEAAQAHRLIEGGHVQGKLVLIPG